MRIVVEDNLLHGELLAAAIIDTPIRLLEYSYFSLQREQSL